MSKPESSSPKDIVKFLNNKFGAGNACFLQDDEDNILKVPVMTSGVLAIDAALVTGGLPKGRICEFFGPEGSGKSTVALMAVAACQKKGGTCVYIDVEQALDPSLAKACGVDMKTLIFSQPDSGDTALNIIDAVLSNGGVDMIVLDSIAALCFKEELEDDKFAGEQTPKVGLLARKVSNAIRQLNTKAAQTGTALIFINQLRSVINLGYGASPTETTTGGRALKFYSSVRLEIKRGKPIKNKETVVGHELFVKVVKNKLAPPFRTAHCSLIYGKGIPEQESLIALAVEHGVLTKKGSWIYWGEERISQGLQAAADRLYNDPEMKNKLEQEVRAAFGTSSFDTSVIEEEDYTEDDSEEDTLLI